MVCVWCCEEATFVLQWYVQPLVGSTVVVLVLLLTIVYLPGNIIAVSVKNSNLFYFFGWLSVTSPFPTKWLVVGARLLKIFLANITAGQASI